MYILFFFNNDVLTLSPIKKKKKTKQNKTKKMVF